MVMNLNISAILAVKRLKDILLIHNTIHYTTFEFSINV